MSSWFTGALDALETELTKREVDKRQAMLDKFAQDDRLARAQDRADARRLQEESLAYTKLQREAAAEQAKQARAVGVANVLMPDADIDEQTAQTLSEGGLGSLVNKIAAPTVTGLGTPTADNPLGLDTTKQGTRFRGTAKQLDAKNQREARQAYISSLPPDSLARQVLEAQEATGDNSIAASLFQHPEEKPQSVEQMTITAFAKGLGKKPSELNQRELLTFRRNYTDAGREPDKPAKPGAPQMFYDAEGNIHAVQYGPNGFTEVPLPPGLVGKTARKTPEQIKAEHAAAAAGNAEGKREAGDGGFSVFSAIGNVFSHDKNKKPATEGKPDYRKIYDY